MKLTNETNSARAHALLRMIVVAAALAAAGAASAQYPNRVIRLLVPYPAGGTTDLMARTLQEPLTATLGQPVIVENKAGAAGGIAAREVAHAAPDGYTLLAGLSGPNSIGPMLHKDAGYDPVKDFAPVSLIAIAPFFLVVNSAVPVQDVKGLIEFARNYGHGVEYSSAGNGSVGHIASALFGKLAGIKLFHVPYKGTAPSTLAVLSGEVKMLLTAPTDAMNNYVKAGRLKLLGVSSAKPSPLAPNAPMISDTLPDFEVEVWFGILAPAGTPQPIIEKLGGAIAKEIARPATQQRFASYGVAATSSTPQELSARIAREVERWGQVIRETGIRTDE